MAYLKTFLQIHIFFEFFKRKKIGLKEAKYSQSIVYCSTGHRILFQILWPSHNILTLTNLKALPEISMEWVPATTAKGILDFKAWFCDLNSSSSSESQSGN